MFNLLHIVYV